MNRTHQRIAINVGGGYVAGINAVITGAVLAANKLGWEVVGIRDGFAALHNQISLAGNRRGPKLTASVTVGARKIRQRRARHFKIFQYAMID